MLVEDITRKDSDREVTTTSGRVVFSVATGKEITLLTEETGAVSDED